MTFWHYFRSQFQCCRDYGLYRKQFKNYLDVILKTRRKKYPIKVILRTGEHLILKNRPEVDFITWGLREYLNFEDNTFTYYDQQKNKIILSNAIKNGDVRGIFINEEYGFLPVEKRQVLDIGSNIGDSSIYFAIKGANHVIALEPYPKNYEIAKNNIHSNNLSNKINLIFGGCSSKNGEMKIDEKQSLTGSVLRENKDGMTVPLFSLQYLLNTNNIDSAVLKMDCEGCEYDSILSSSKDTLRKFSHIQIEYHYGYKNLKKKLEECGFQVSVTRPSKILHEGMFTGYIYATRI